MSAERRERMAAKQSMNEDRERIHCVLREYRQEIIDNGLNGLPPEIRDLALYELFGSAEGAGNELK
jgi:hypothetical protein